MKHLDKLFIKIIIVVLGWGLVIPVIAQASFKTTNQGNTFIYNPRSLTWMAIHDGQIIRSGRGSAGSSYCSDIHRACKTPSGTYTVFSKGNSHCHSSRYPLGRGGAKMPYCMFFNKNYAIHGSYELPNYNASHGCIRVPPNEAKWLSQDFIKIGTKVVVKSY